MKINSDLSFRSWEMLQWGVRKSDVEFIRESLEKGHVLVIVERKGSPLICSIAPNRTCREIFPLLFE